MKQPKAVEAPWSILKLLRWAPPYFESRQVENPRASAEILLAHALGLRRIDLYVKYDQPLVADELARFKSLIKRRAAHEPVAYITGEKEFWSLTFTVTPDVLIPRPETECLVEAALELIPESSEKKFRMLDLGTGSGSIIVALASERPDAVFFASDCSEKAVNIARENAARHLLSDKIHFYCGEWLAPLNAEVPENFDLIVSNPPYIRSEEISRLQPDVARYEPVRALDGGADGLDDIRRVVDSSYNYLADSGWLMIEIGYDQKKAVDALITQHGGYEPPIFLQDYGHRDRVVQVRKKNG